MGKPEELVFGRIKRRIRKLKKLHPMFWFRFHGGGRSKRGIPDISMTIYGFSVYVELKAEKGKATKLQEQRIAEIHAAGGFAGVVRNVDEFDALLQSVFDHCYSVAGRFGPLHFAVCKACRRIVGSDDLSCHCGEDLIAIGRNLDRGRVDV